MLLRALQKMVMGGGGGGGGGGHGLFGENQVVSFIVTSPSGCKKNILQRMHFKAIFQSSQKHIDLNYFIVF